MRSLLPWLNGLLLAGYPLAVYWGLVHFRARNVGLLLLALWLPGLVARLRGLSRAALRGVLGLPLLVVLLLAGSAWFDDRRFVLALPVAINLVLLTGFAGSLRATPMVERFARMQEPQLSPAQVVYCRSVTVVWCGFFLVNACVSAYLAAFAPVSVWALYTGLVAYAAIGTLASVEYIVRKYKFRDYGRGLHDRLLARVFPPLSGVVERAPEGDAR